MRNYCALANGSIDGGTIERTCGRAQGPRLPMLSSSSGSNNFLDGFVHTTAAHFGIPPQARAHQQESLEMQYTCGHLVRLVNVPYLLASSRYRIKVNPSKLPKYIDKRRELEAQAHQDHYARGKEHLRVVRRNKKRKRRKNSKEEKSGKKQEKERARKEVEKSKREKGERRKNKQENETK